MVDENTPQTPAPAPAAETPATATPAPEAVPEKAAAPIPHIGAQTDGDGATPATSLSTPTSSKKKAKPAKDPSEKGTSPFMLIIVALLCLAIGAMGMWAYTNYQEQQAGNNSEGQGVGTETDTTDTDTDLEAEETEESEEGADLSVVYTGTTVTGDAPSGWTITEYHDGNGSDMLTDGGVYVGLTGLTISNPADEVVFRLEAVWGIGGVDACGNYYEFPDSSATYYTQIVASSSAVGVTPVVTTYTVTDYTEFDLFGLSVRRVGTNLYWDPDDTDSYFNAACGIGGAIFIFDSPTYTADGNVRGDYQFTVASTATPADLLILDDILASLAVLP